MNVAADPLSRLTIRKIAWEVREIIGCVQQEFFPIVRFIEWVLCNPNNEYGMEFEIAEPWEMQNTYGTTNTGKNKMIIRSDVYDRAVQGSARDRFTLCHELGHFILHQPGSISYARGNVPAYRNPEWQANTFAAELMAPVELVKNMSIEEMMEKCEISYQAAEIQYNIIHK